MHDPACEYERCTAVVKKGKGKKNPHEIPNVLYLYCIAGYSGVYIYYMYIYGGVYIICIHVYIMGYTQSLNTCCMYILYVLTLSSNPGTSFT